MTTKSIEERAQEIVEAEQNRSSHDIKIFLSDACKEDIATAMREVAEECAGVAKGWQPPADESWDIEEETGGREAAAQISDAIRARFNIGGDDG